MSDSDISALQRQLQEAIANLWWPSETDAPFELNHWPEAFKTGFSSQALLALTGHNNEGSCNETSVQTLFQQVTQEQDWHGDEETAEVQRFQQLKDLILDAFSEVRVVKVGQVNIDIYIIGRTQANGWLVLSTKAVET
ncbi:MAG: nuclease A inhibitor family protein [Cyanobacteria bacterium P01_F01_bin.42]